MRVARPSTLALLTGTLVLASLQPASAAVVIVNGSGGTPLGQAITIEIDGHAMLAYGIDITQPLIFGTFAGEIVNLTDYANGPRAAWIYENFGTVEGVGLAVQLAIWDVMNDNGDGLSSGPVQVAPSFPVGMRILAESMISSSLGQSSQNAIIVELVASGISWQPIITGPLPKSTETDPLPGPNPAPGGGDPSEVPEPGTWMLMAGGLGLIRLRTRRSR